MNQIEFLKNHFTPSKKIMPLRHNGLPGVKENEKKLVITGLKNDFLGLMMMTIGIAFKLRL